MDTPHRTYIETVFACRCPRCREGKLFTNALSIRIKRNMEMPERCPVCGQLTDIEVGFYYGTGYVSYLICIVISLLTFLFWWLLIGFSFEDDRFLTWVTFNSLLLLALQPWLMRFSRSLWLSFFVHYDPDWSNTKPDHHERRVEGQMNNW